MHFLEKLQEIEKKYEELTVQLGDARILADQTLYQKAAKSHADLREVVEKFREWKELEETWHLEVKPRRRCVFSSVIEDLPSLLL